MAGAGDWLRAANPLGRAESEAEAVRAARVGAVSLAVMAVQGVAGLPLAISEARRIVPAAMARTMPADGDPVAAQVSAAMVELMPTVLVASTLVFSAIYLVLAVVQWRRPNPIIPGIVLALTAYALVSQLAAPFNPMMAGIRYPAWLLAYGVASNLAHLALQTASLRGALRLGRLRPGAPLDPQWEQARLP